MGALPLAPAAKEQGCYLMGFHFSSYVGSRSKQRFKLPWMSGSGYNEVTLFPNGIIALRMAEAAQLPAGEQVTLTDDPATMRAVDRRVPF